MSVRTRPLLHRLIITLAVLYVLGTILGGIGLGWIALHPPSHARTANEERNVRAAAERAAIAFKDVELQASFHPTVDAGFLYVRLRYGFNMENASPEQAVVATAVPILLIHGLDDHNIPP